MNILIIFIVATLYSFIIYLILRNRLDKRVTDKKFLKEIREEINSLITQINETSDRNVTLLENRLERLTTLLGEADKRIGTLRERDRDEKKIITPPEITLSKSVEDEKDVKDDEALSLKERIILLNNQGISPAVIAKKTETTIGEVELIITLNRG